MPAEAPFAKIDMAKDVSLCDVFAVVLDVDKHVRESWDREAANLPSAARGTKFIFEVALANHNNFQLTEGMRPENPNSATEQRKELWRLNLTHVFHEVYCKLKENFPTLNSHPKNLKERTKILQTRLNKAMTDSGDVEIEDA